MSEFRPVLTDAARSFREHWRELALAAFAYKLAALALLTPVVGLLFRLLLAASGKTVLADQDILLFLLEPLGWVCFIVGGALAIGILALEQAALLEILRSDRSRRGGWLGGLRFASANAWRVVQVTARLIAFALLALVPFAVVAGLTYTLLLSEHDINFYLQQKPPVFQVALAIGGVLVVSLLAVLLRLASGWLFALPLVLFEDVRPSRVLRASSERAAGGRLELMRWIFVWGLALLALSALTSTLVVGLGRALVPQVGDSLALLALVIGAILMLWAVTGLAVNLLASTSFACLLMDLYRRRGGGEALAASHPPDAASPAGAAGPLLTSKRLWVAGAASVAAALVVGVLLLKSVPLADHVEVTAHRGASKAAPENTLAAVAKALEAGADWVEIDVQETADGEVVVFHDSDFMKLAGVDLKIWDATLADLAGIDIGSRFDPAFSEERVPTLGEVLELCRGRAGVNIELKYYGHDDRLEQRVVDLVEAHRMVSEVMLMSLKLDAVKKLKSLRPDWTVGLLMSVSAGNLARLDADFLAVNAGLASRRFVRAAHDMGKAVHVWTVNDAATMSTMIGRGVDSLITDDPALARSVIEQRAQMSLPERLLLEFAGILGVVPEIEEI